MSAQKILLEAVCYCKSRIIGIVRRRLKCVNAVNAKPSPANAKIVQKKMSAGIPRLTNAGG
jgi:hypothetical protein